VEKKDSTVTQVSKEVCCSYD